MKKTFFILCFLVLVVLSGVSGAAVYTLTPPDTLSGSQPDLQDMDHYKYYVWGFDFGAPVQFESATLTFQKIWNNTVAPGDKLSAHLMDSGSKVIGTTPAPTFTGAMSGVSMKEWVYGDTNGGIDNFENAAGYVNPWGSPDLLFRWYNAPLVPTGDVNPANSIPTTFSTRRDMTYEFTDAEISRLNELIATGNDFALGFDPDCHYPNERVILTLVTVPEASAALTFAAGLAGLIAYRRKKRLM